MNQALHLKSTPDKILKTIAAAIFILLNIIFLSAESTNAQIDTTFGINGVTTTDLSEYETPVAAFVLPDTKILVVARSSNAFNDYYFLRYNNDGTPDLTYGSGGKVHLAFPSTPSPTIFNAVRQTDGKIILVGKYSGSGVVARFNADGTPDTSFANGGVHRPNINQTADDGSTDIVVQPDGKILICGFNQIPFQQNFNIYLLRYNSDGTLDESFGNEGYITHYNLFTGADGQNVLLLQSSGKIIIVAASNANGSPGFVRRFNSNGTIDDSFSTITFPAKEFIHAAAQSDDKILFASYAQDTSDPLRTNVLISRYSADGSVDASFGSGGQTSIDVTGDFDDVNSGLKILPSGEILAAAKTNIQPNRSQIRGTMLSLIKLSPTGAVNGKLLVTKSLKSFRSSILAQPDGKIIVIDSVNNSLDGKSDILLTRVSGVPLQTYAFKGVPFDFRYLDLFGTPELNGIADPSVFRPSERKWYVNNVFPGYFFGLADDILVPSDYILDLATDLAVFRPGNGTWYIAKNYNNAATNYIEIQWGQNGDVPAPADFDGDGKSDLAVFRPSNGTWYIRKSSDGSGIFVQWGLNGDKPAQGDFDGDGKTDIAVFRPSDGNWYVLKSSDGQAFVLHFGASGDVPVQEDYDGDGKTDIAVWRPSDGVWYRLNSFDGSFFAFHWGVSTDIPVPADYDGDLKTDIAVWRPSPARWYVFQSSTNSTSIYNWGTTTDVPLEGKQ